MTETGVGTTTIAGFIEHAWGEHAEDASGVAARLAQAVPLLNREPERTGDFMTLAGHVLLAHLGDADAMAHWVDRLAPLSLEHPDAGPPLTAARLSVALLRGEPADLTGHPSAVVVRAHGGAAQCAAAQGDEPRARLLLQAAEAHAGARDADAVKALATAAHELAWHLLEAPRAPAVDALMMDAAELAQRRWHQAGTWLQAQRADHLLALGAAAVGDGARAMRHAGACLSICTAHGADAAERFHAHEALARAALAAGHGRGAADAVAQMRKLLDELPDARMRRRAQSTCERLQRGLAAR
jgi:hypothetical protein